MKKNRECSSTRLNLDIGESPQGHAAFAACGFLLRSRRAGSVTDGHGQLQSDLFDSHNPFIGVSPRPSLLARFPQPASARETLLEKPLAERLEHPFERLHSRGNIFISVRRRDVQPSIRHQMQPFLQGAPQHELEHLPVVV